MAYRNNTLPGAYNDLEYANYTPVVPMRPVKELTDLYAAKQQDYIYAKDAASRLGTAIVNTPHTADDEGAIRQVNQEVNSVLEQWQQEGDYENRKLDVNKLVQDVTKKLMPLQQKKAQESAWLETALARDKEGNYIHNPNDVKKAQVINSKINKPSVYDPELGTYIGSFKGVDVPINKNYSKAVDDVMKGWEKNEIVLTDSNGNPLVRLPETGYLQAGSKTYTDDAELINAAKSYLMSDPDYLHKVQFDLTYDLSTLTDNYGNPRSVNMSDILQLPSEVVTKVAKEYDLVSGKPLEEQLKEKGIPLEDFYKNVKVENDVNRTIQLGVSKQSFEAYKNTYLKDDLLLDWEKTHGKNAPTTPIDDGYTAITKVFTDNQMNPTDYNNIKSGYEASKSQLQTSKGELNKAIQSGATPEQLTGLKDRVDRDSENLENFDRQLKSLRTHIETVSKFDFVPYYLAYTQERKKEINKEMEELVKKSKKFNISPEEKAAIDKQLLEKTAFGVETLPQYKDKVMDAFINGEKFSVANNFTSGLTDPKSRIDKAAEDLRTAYGGDVETKPYNVDYHTINVEGEGKKALLYKNFIKSKKEALKLSPETFVNGEDNLFVLMDKEGINPSDVDLEKSDIHFLVESYNKKPGYVIALKDKEGNPLGKLTVNHIGDILDDRDIVNSIVADEAYNRFKDSDINDLDITEKAVFKKLALSYFDNSPASKYFDDLNLYATNEGEELPFYINGKRNEEQQPDLIIATKKNFANPDQNQYTIKLPSGRVLSDDGTGNPTWLYEGDGKAIMFNSPSEIKEELGSTLLLDNLNKREEEQANPYMFSQSSNNLDSIAHIFVNDIKEGVSPYVDKSIIPYVSSLKTNFPGLFITDSYREADSATGSRTSNHKKGKALDFRINEESIKLMKMDKDILSKYGISIIEPHNGNKGIASTLAEADHLHVEFN